ncbi:MAG: hypothetical protein EOO48_06290 [Flavobacterium sp.]|nr:MAG: hypothetical protein EOO48_06290 [Flavobacterium sp.]
MKKLNYLLIATVCLVFQITLAQKAAAPADDEKIVEPILIKDPVTQCAYRYHYYPNLCAYYDAKANLYIFKQNGEWQKAKEIPSGYMGYSLNNKVNVVITDYDDDDPTQFIKLHKKKYPYNFHQKLKEVTSAE